MSANKNPSPAALIATGLGFHVGGVQILADVNLEVAAGSFLGIIGPNGAGKTTLLNLLSGLLRASAGSVCLEGVDVTHVAPAGRARLGVGRTFQTSSLFNSLSVFENARLSAQARLGGNAQFWHRPRATDAGSVAAHEALERVGLSAQASQPTGTLSHGDKRKLELAILLAGEARILLLDEPMAGVHSEDVPRLTTLIGELHGEGRTVLMVEHHMSVVVGLADSIAVLDSGRLLASGTPDAVIANEDVQAAYLGQPL